ncbi:MAG: dihydroorotate dehydrogenase electron transfer subunit [Candidatus Bathyarchaeia archaeon]
MNNGSQLPSTPNRPRMVRLRAVRSESEYVKVFTFKDQLCAEAKPGQFIMVWVPGAEEVPMSLTLMDWRRGVASFAVKKVGETTEALHQLRGEAVIGVRGPYGNGFGMQRGASLIVGGGTGLSPLLPLAENLANAGAKVTILAGAKTKTELLFLRNFKRVGEVIATTEDGTYGLKGVVTQTLAKVLEERRRIKQVYACGSELMLKEVVDLAVRYSIPVQVSLERYMKCGVGICGSCMLGKYRVCRDGPVFSGVLLSKIEEFGFWKRDATGKSVPV